ncbi:MAG TPA: hypothetical protein PKW98_17425 [Candidatus Wallbacteria bacterium]|nr:MAG: hypothetical protein BWY32_03807 [bacterium ADurb.Bin243]HPG59603.1 hypothetical protein [Candidatus Wallbacteria bacterium]
MKIHLIVSELIIALIKRKLYYIFKFSSSLLSLILKSFLLFIKLLNKVNADSFIFAAAFFALGFFLYGEKFKPDARRKGDI